MSSSFRAFALNIHSAFNIPGAVPTGMSDPAIRIQRGRQSLSRIQAARGRYTYDGKNLLIHSAVADYCCVDGCRILVESLQGPASPNMEYFISSLAMPAVLWMRGSIVLHGGAAILPGQVGAVAILGASGSGKSTVLRQLVEMGARIVADDAVSLSFDGPQILASGLPALLWMRSGDAAADEPRDPFEVPGAQRADVSPLHAVFILAAREAREGAIEALSPDQAMVELLRYRYRPNALSALGRANQILPALAYLAERMPTSRWRRQEGRLALSSDELTRIRAA